ncbi:MAG: hypothetical protein RL563_1605 [Pseudomonadota bacterium]|jgi:hypothetical protein
MQSLKQLEQQKADLDLSIAKSLEVAKKVALELERARIRQEIVDKGANEIMALMEKYSLSQEDIFPSRASKETAMALKQSKTLAEMRTYFNRR